MRKVYCDYCGRQAEYVDSKVVYGKSYGMMYLCRNCMAYVGVHKGTDKPLGRLANAELRYWKKRAHAVFDPCGNGDASAATATRLMAGWPRRWACPWSRPISGCLMWRSVARPSISSRTKREEEVHMDEKRSPEELLAQLCLEPGFVLVPQDRFEELVRAEAERDVLEATILGENRYAVGTVLDAIKKARNKVLLGKPEVEGDAQ